jgi:hypothetical protein
MPAEYSVTVPDGVILPTRDAASSVNHMSPSAPAAICDGSLSGVTPLENSVIVTAQAPEAAHSDAARVAASATASRRPAVDHEAAARRTTKDRPMVITAPIGRAETPGTATGRMDDLPQRARSGATTVLPAT